MDREENAMDGGKNTVTGMARELRDLALVAAAFVIVGISACQSGSGSDSDTGDASQKEQPADPDDGSTTVDLGSFFAANVQPNLDFCRSCHVPDGVADVEDGRDFMLGTDPRHDLGNLETSWERLGGNNPTSRILLMASGQETPHTGGAPWPEDSEAYAAMDLTLRCFEYPEGCPELLADADTGGEDDQRPLLTSEPRGAHVWHEFCEDQPDDASLPTDPRRLVTPGVNEGKAVVFNAHWKECSNAIEKPANCGELRELTARGELVGAGHGEPGTATMFSGSESAPLFSISADKYNRLWRIWGLSERPEQFDRLVAERYGSPPTPGNNPYPLPGEDPNEANGGSGQLPLVLTQMRDETGSWTGRIGVKLCSSCHSGQVGRSEDGPGLGTQYGGAGHTGDFSVMFRDFAAVGALPFAPFNLVTIATNRGTGAIDQFQIGFLAFSNGDPMQLANEKILFSKAIGTIKSPPWWNLAYRPQKFHGAILPTDASRIDMAANYPFQHLLQGRDPVDWVDQADVPFQLWAESLEPPPYPLEVNAELARRGAILFHNKDLWAENLDNPVPEPPEGGNGSCASCHGVYSPRYAHDPAFLDDPRLAGIAARTVPLSVIGTDPTYAEGMESLKNSDGSYNRAIEENIFVQCGLGNVGRSTTPEMLAPPLWGIWAAAPYFHNGSVPNIWGVLDPEGGERPDIWRRVSAPAPEGLEGQVVMDFDTDIERAYEPDKLGWEYETLQCGDPGTQPARVCDPTQAGGSSVLRDIMGKLYSNIALLWNLPRPEGLIMTESKIEERKIYNTHEYGQGNQGHEFTSVLTDTERRALIEYLKTL